MIERRPTGRIVGIIRRKWRQYCGILQANPVKGVSHILNSKAEHVAWIIVNLLVRVIASNLKTVFEETKLNLMLVYNIRKRTKSKYDKLNFCLIYVWDIISKLSVMNFKINMILNIMSWFLCFKFCVILYFLLFEDFTWILKDSAERDPISYI